MRATKGQREIYSFTRVAEVRVLGMCRFLNFISNSWIEYRIHVVKLECEVNAAAIDCDRVNFFRNSRGEAGQNYGAK